MPGSVQTYTGTDATITPVHFASSSPVGCQWDRAQATRLQPPCRQLQAQRRLGPSSRQSRHPQHGACPSQYKTCNAQDHRLGGMQRWGTAECSTRSAASGAAPGQRACQPAARSSLVAQIFNSCSQPLLKRLTGTPATGRREQRLPAAGGAQRVSRAGAGGPNDATPGSKRAGVSFPQAGRQSGRTALPGSWLVKYVTQPVCSANRRPSRPAEGTPPNPQLAVCAPRPSAAALQCCAFGAEH
jgi:hypothetical protein